MKNLHKKVVIFDFDGTLADVVPIMRDIYDEFVAKKGYPELTDEKFEELRAGSVRAALKWMKISPWKLPGLMNEGRNMFAKRTVDVKLFDGAPELVQSLDKQGWEIYILSSNKVSTINNVLKKYEIKHLIKVLRRPKLFGKAASIKALVKRKKLQKSAVWMVGDEVRDVQAGNKAGVQSVGVSWGLQHETALLAAKPTHLARNFAELYKILGVKN